MPELPEVETIRLGLQKYLVGHTIVDVEIKLKKIVTGDTTHVIGSKIVGVRRFGKGLVIDLDNDYSIAIHIKLTGQLIYQKVSRVSQVPRVSRGKVGMVPNKWTHVIFKLKTDNSSHSGKRSASRIHSASSGQVDSGQARLAVASAKRARMTDAYLYYNDFRQFGWIKIIKSSELKAQSFFKDLGPEFLKNLTLDKFTEIVKKSKIAIKVLLMDQKKMSGVGNIYANDALNLAKIDPRRSSSTLNKEEIKTLYKAVEKVLRKGIESGGASEFSYVNALGQEGTYQNHFIAYGREGQPCKNCSTPLKKIKLGGRGTYLCPKCQR